MTFTEEILRAVIFACVFATTLGLWIWSRELYDRWSYRRNRRKERADFDTNVHLHQVCELYSAATYGENWQTDASYQVSGPQRDPDWNNGWTWTVRRQWRGVCFKVTTSTIQDGVAGVAALILEYENHHHRPSEHIEQARP